MQVLLMWTSVMTDSAPSRSGVLLFRWSHQGARRWNTAACVLALQEDLPTKATASPTSLCTLTRRSLRRWQGIFRGSVFFPNTDRLLEETKVAAGANASEREIANLLYHGTGMHPEGPSLFSDNHAADFKVAVFFWLSSLRRHLWRRLWRRCPWSLLC